MFYSFRIIPDINGNAFLRVATTSPSQPPQSDFGLYDVCAKSQKTVLKPSAGSASGYRPTPRVLKAEGDFPRSRMKILRAAY
jgi:hypothetical protein